MNETLKFRDFMSLRQFQVPKDDQNRFMDSILSSMEKQKDSVSEDAIQGLQVTKRATHSGRLTGHFHYYPAAHVRKGTDSFTQPYEKPALAHHAEDEDAIGRIVRASYISTQPAIMPDSLFHLADQTLGIDKKSLAYIKKMKSYLYDKRFEGLGYVQTVSNITDASAIQKIIDGRYTTISVGYGTNSLVCSDCFQDAAKEGPCEHLKGVDYGSGANFKIFGPIWYDEESYVNRPADDLAANVDIKKILIPVQLQLKDSINNTKSKKKLGEYALAYEAADSMVIMDSLRVPSTNLSLYLYDKDSDNYISNNISTEENGEQMKLATLKKDADLYSKVSANIEESKRLTKEQIDALSDTDFVGANRLFVAIDADHIIGAKAILETVTDSNEKSELIAFLDERLTKLTTDAAPEPVAAETTTDATIETETPVVLPRCIVSKDYITYNFKIEANGFGMPDDDDPCIENEKKILDLLLSMYAGKTTDAMEVIDGILNRLGENKDEVVAALAKDTIAGVEARVDNFKNEQLIWKDKETNLSQTVANLTEELKDHFVNKLMSFQDKEDPTKTNESIVADFRGKSLAELRAADSVMSQLFPKAKVASTVITDETHKFNTEGKDGEVTQELIETLERNAATNYTQLFSTNPSMAKSFLATQRQSIDSLKAKLKENKNQK